MSVLRAVLHRLSLATAVVLAPAAAAQSRTDVAPSPAHFVPTGQIVVQEIRGDLNRDGVPDRVLLIKGTDPSRIVTDRDRGRLDRNRRGLVIAFGTAGGYTRALVHPDCFSSENEDGGVYFPPDLVVSIEKGALRLHYAHGRYGYWAYTYRHQNGDFELIGYDSSENRGPVVLREVSINLSTRRMRIRSNPDPANDDGDAKLRERWKTVSRTGPYRLRDVADFDGYDVASELDPAGR